MKRHRDRPPPGPTCGRGRVEFQSLGSIGFALGGADGGSGVLAAGIFSVLTSTVFGLFVVAGFGIPLAVLGYVHADRAKSEGSMDGEEQ